MAPYALVIAEDNPKDFEFLKQMVADWEQDCVIEHAPDGLIALELAQAHDEPLIISDIQMPQMNGVEFAKALWERKPKARIVFWSQFKDEMYVRTLAKIVPPETVYGYVLKSSPREKISAAMATVLFGDQCWIDPEVRKVQGRTGHRQTALSDIEYEALVDLCLGLTDNLIAQRRYLSRRGVQSRLNSLYGKLSLDQEQFQSDKVGDAFNLRNRAFSVALRRGLINSFELEHEEEDLQVWLKRYKSGMG